MTMRFYKYFFILSIFCSTVFLSGCEDEDLEQVSFTFTGVLGGNILEGQSASVRLQASRPLTTNSTVLLGYKSDFAKYGVNFTTIPQSLTEGEIRLNLPTDSVITIYAINDDVLVNGGYEIELFVKEFTGEFQSAVNSTVKVRVQDPPTAIYSLDDCSGAVPSPFFVERAAGSNTAVWECTDFGQTGNAVEANAFRGSSDPADAWFILDINQINSSNGTLASADLTKFLIEMDVYSRFSGLGSISMLTSTDYSGSGDPTAATWTEIPAFAENAPAAGSRVWEKISIDASAAVGQAKGYVAVRFTGGVEGNSSNWRIDDVVVFASK